MRGCAMLAALSLAVLLAACGLAGFGVRSGAVDPIATTQAVGPVQVVSFILCRSTMLHNPCTSGRRTYEVWLVVDWKLLDAGDRRSYLLLNMALD
jgi:hypothetical protein